MIYLIIYICIFDNLPLLIYQSLCRIIGIILYSTYFNNVIENFIVKFSYIFLTKSSNYPINESSDPQIIFFFRKMKSVSYKKLYNVMPRR